MSKPITKLESIEKTAIQLFASYGIKQVTIKEIASKSKCSEGALYRHYKSKEEMAWELYKREVEIFGKKLRNILNCGLAFPDKLGSAVELFYKLFDEDQTKFSFILLSKYNFSKSRKIDPGLNPFDLVTDLIKIAVKRNEINIDNPELYSAMILGLVLQPPTFVVSKRIKGKIGNTADAVTRSCLKVLNYKR
ncbi:MAG: TetR/AcrR family transcriptional regulator [Thermodesulfobacteriota bacterium]